MSQPPGFTTNNKHEVLKLNKSLYGLKQAARIWYQALDKLLKEFNFRRIVVDYGVWVQNNTNTMILAHIDDILLSGSRDILDTLKPKINAVYSFKDLGPASIFLGIKITRDRLNRQVYLDQGHYASGVLRKFGVTYSASTPINSLTFPPSPSFDTATYQGAIGSLLCLALGTRPDIAYAVIKLAQFSSNPTIMHWSAVRRILAYLYGTVNYRILLTPSIKHASTNTKPSEPAEPSVPQLIGYFDSSYADDINDRYSTCGYVFFYMGGPVSWRSKKQQVLALSSTEAEYIAATEAAKESQWISSFLNEIGYPVSYTTLYGDNRGANSLTMNPMYHSRTKHIDVRFRYVNELTESGSIKIEHCSTKKMIVDILTKPLPKDSFLNLRHALNIRPPLASQSKIAPKVVNTGRKRGGTSSPPFMCQKCTTSFLSRNALFTHLQATAHFDDTDITTTSVTLSE